MRAVVGADALDISASKLVIVSDGVAFAILRPSHRPNAGGLRLVLRSGTRCGLHNIFAYPTSASGRAAARRSGSPFARQACCERALSGLCSSAFLKAGAHRLGCGLPSEATTHG